MAGSAAPARITILFGKESAIADRALAEVTAALRAAEGSLERVTVRAPSDEAAGVIADAMSPNLFGDPILLVITETQDIAEDADAVLRGAIADLPDHVWLVVAHSGVVKGKNLLDTLRKAGAEQVDCKELKGKALQEFLVKEVARHRRKMTSDALQAMTDAIGNDLPMLLAAVSQLCADVEADPIGLADVQAYFDGVAEVSGFAIADAVWSRQPVQALRLLRWAMTSGDVAVPSVMALASGLRTIVRVASVAPGASDADVAREAGVPPWKVQVLRRQWQQWSGDQRRLALAAVALADADAAMKGGVEEGVSLDPEQKLRELERLVLVTAARASG